MKRQKNDYNEAEAITDAALRPNLRTVREKSQDQLRYAGVTSVSAHNGHRQFAECPLCQ